MEDNKQIFELAPNTLLCNGKYTIESITGSNDFGVTYKARQDGESDFVCVLQYSPQNIAAEELEANRQKFVEDARILANFDHENIVRVLALFAENDVVYLVIPFVEGLIQKELLKAGSDLPKYVPEIEKTKEYIKSQGVAEELLPKKPHFLYLPDYSVMLVHFGAVQVFNNVIPQNPVGADLRVCPETDTPKPTIETPQKSETQQPQKFKPQYATLACPACKRPLPICICQKYKTINL